MKQITAYIKPHKLSDVTLALHQVEGLSGMSVTEGKGFGRGKAKESKHSIQDDLIDYITHARIEIVCDENLVEEIITAIETNAHTGLRGDGKIYIAEMESVVRISTGERGDRAI